MCLSRHCLDCFNACLFHLHATSYTQFSFHWSSFLHISYSRQPPPSSSVSTFSKSFQPSPCPYRASAPSPAPPSCWPATENPAKNDAPSNPLNVHSTWNAMPPCDNDSQHDEHWHAAVHCRWGQCDSYIARAMPCCFPLQI